MMFGMWITNGYSGEMSFTWIAPHIREVGALLMKWLPLLALGICSTAVLAFRQRDLLLTALIVCFLATIYTSACWWAFDLALRTTFDNLAPIAIGLAVAAHALHRVRPGTEWMALVLPPLWNVPFMMPYDSTAASLVDLLSKWRYGLSLLF
jgi:hypothetical protein